MGMLNYLISIVRPTNTKSAIISSCISVAASKLAAGTVTKATILLAGVMVLPHNQAANVVTQALMSLMMPPIQIAKAPAQVASTIRKAGKTDALAARRTSNRLYLRSLEKEYTCVFTGKVTCGGGLCNNAGLRVHVASKKNPDIIKSANVDPDGNYAVSFFLKASLNDHVDWWIIADSPDSASKQVQGRQIMMDNTTVTIEEPIRLL